MAYFNHAFYKTFVATSTQASAGTATSALTAGQLGIVTDATWQTIAISGGTLPANSLAYLVQGSYYTRDTIGNNPGNGGYKESVKSKGINPKFISRVWETNCISAVQSTATLSLASDCAPCGKTQFMRMDVKGSPTLRFLNHNAYSIGDSANICCIDNQLFLDVTLVSAAMAQMVLANPLIKPFVAEGDPNGVQTATLAGGSGYSVASGVATTGGTGSGFKVNILTVTSGAIATFNIAARGTGYTVGDVLTVAGGTGGTFTVTALTVGGVVVTLTTAGVSVQTVYTIDQALGTAASGNYTPSTDPNGVTKVSATVHFVGAYVDTKFGNCSFDTRDHFNAEPVVIIASILDETGNPCNDCGVATSTPGQMQQTQGESVVRDLILSESYRQSPFNQGNTDSSRIREIEMSDELLASVDRAVTYKAYYIQHTVPRFNNPTGVFDNDQYVYQIYVKCSDTTANTNVLALVNKMVALANTAGNPIALETNSYW